MQTSPDPNFKNPKLLPVDSRILQHVHASARTLTADDDRWGCGLGQATDIAEFCFSVMEELNTTGSLDGMEHQNVDLFKSVANRFFSVFLEPTASHSALIFLRCLCCSIKKKPQAAAQISCSDQKLR